MPCLYVPAVALMIAALIGGVIFLHRAVKRRSGPSLFGAIVLLAPLLWYAGWCHRTNVDWWNPLMPKEALHGLWMHGVSSLHFFADGTFRIDAHGEAARRVQLTTATGRWTLVDYHLTLDVGDGYPRRMRVVVANGAYRLVEAPEDFGTWAPWTGFNRIPPVPAPDYSDR
jgi:hypothetical protein